MVPEVVYNQNDSSDSLMGLCISSQLEPLLLWDAAAMPADEVV